METGCCFIITIDYIEAIIFKKKTDQENHDIIRYARRRARMWRPSTG